jgi:hypothetical protein
MTANYRPISILSKFAKILEQIMYRRLNSFYEVVGFINENQFGFVKRSSTITAAMNFITAVIFIDMLKAFDYVDHGILLDKLYKSTIRGTFYELLESYLSNRFQIVNIDGFSSQKRMVNCGIPQDSVQGLLLFSLYVNDIFELPLRRKLQLYADDAVVIYSHKEADNVFADMQHDLNLSSNWFYNNCLTVNAGKSKNVIFKDNLTTQTRLTIDGNEIERVEHLRYLGLIVDSLLNWDEHINHVKSKVKYIIPIKSRLKIFHAHVYSHMLYMNAVWNTAYGFGMTTLSRLLNKAIRTGFLRSTYIRWSTSTLSTYTTDTTFLPLQAFLNWRLPRWCLKLNII